MFKRFTVNTLVSVLSLLLMSVIFTVTGFLILEKLNSSARHLMPTVFILVLLLGCFIGTKLYYRNSLSIISVIILPVVLCVVLYLVGLAVPYLGYMIQYPSAVWSETFGLSSDFMNEHNVIRYYAVLLAHYFASSLSLFIGAYKVKQ